MTARLARPHVPMRPLWLCRACAAPWPCPPARLALLVEYGDDREALLVHLNGLLQEATAQLSLLSGHAAPDGMTDRFLSWARVRG